MGRKKQNHTTRIGNIEYKIALWEMSGGLLSDEYWMAQGLRVYFDGIYDEAAIDKNKLQIGLANPELMQNYHPGAQPEPEPTTTNGRAPKQRKTGVFREVKTVKNRSGQGGKYYRWAYDVTYVDGVRVKSKSVGRVKD